MAKREKEETKLINTYANHFFFWLINTYANLKSTSKYYNITNSIVGGTLASSWRLA